MRLSVASTAPASTWTSVTVAGTLERVPWQADASASGIDVASIHLDFGYQGRNSWCGVRGRRMLQPYGCQGYRRHQYPLGLRLLSPELLVRVPCQAGATTLRLPMTPTSPASTWTSVIVAGTVGAGAVAGGCSNLAAATSVDVASIHLDFGYCRRICFVRVPCHTEASTLRLRVSSTSAFQSNALCMLRRLLEPLSC